MEELGRQLASKWDKTAALLSHPRIAPHIPPTRLLTEANLRSMLAAHGMVVVKPVKGAGGHGVIKVTKSGSGYAYTYYTKKKHFASFGEMYRSLDRMRKGRRYLIQKGIRLATIQGRPVDYRVKHVKENGAWQIRAIVGRWAKPGLFVTNLCRGGQLLSGSEGIRRSFSAAAVAGKKQKMRELTRLGTEVLETRFPGLGQLGFDFGIDQRGKLWIFEVNTRPQ
ncbi:YheC/YheD family protein [Paenibacillus xanthanilyticus]|uniref:YheC/YheD family protein n=1 Tax=Paenibacillus xanthanilyticus TaxID=1783531 RepID=A0ABV8KAF8_9BACL